MDYSYASVMKYIKEGREIELTVKDEQYFISRESDEKWYLLHCKTDQYQYFSTSQELIKKALVNGKNFLDAWEDIVIDFVL